jgi:hypothetical protein
MRPAKKKRLKKNPWREGVRGFSLADFINQAVVISKES